MATHGSVPGRNVGGRGAIAIWKVHSVLALVQFSDAGSNILSKVAFTSGVDPMVFTLYRDVTSFLFLTPLAFFSERGRRTTLDRTTVALIVLLGFLGMYCTIIATSFGMALAPATYSSLITITTPIFVFIISAACGLEEIQWTRRGGQAKVGGVLSAVCGGILIPLYNGPEIIGPFRGTHTVPMSEFPLDASGALGPTLSNLKIEDWQLGGFLLILVGLFRAIYWTLQAQIMKRYPAPITLAASAHLIALILLIPTALVTVQDHSLWALPQLSDMIPILYAALVPSGVNFALQSWVSLESGPVLLNSYKPLQSFATISMACLFLGESIHLGSVLGLICIVNGLFLFTWGQVHSLKEAGRPVKSLPGTPDGVSIIEGDSNLEHPLLG